MRLAVTGAQNTGKTTFIEDFVAAFPHYTTPSTTYRDVVNQHGLKINQDTREGSQLLIRDFLLSQIEDNPDENILFDRFILDNYVYSLAQYHAGHIRREFIDESREILYKSLDLIDTLVFIPTGVGIELVDDELRDIDRHFVDYVNSLFLEEILTLTKLHPIPVWIISGTRETRINQLAKKMNFELILK